MRFWIESNQSDCFERFASRITLHLLCLRKLLTTDLPLYYYGVCMICATGGSLVLVQCKPLHKEKAVYRYANVYGDALEFGACMAALNLWNATVSSVIL